MLGSSQDPRPVQSSTSGLGTEGSTFGSSSGGLEQDARLETQAQLGPQAHGQNRCSDGAHREGKRRRRLGKE